MIVKSSSQELTELPLKELAKHYALPFAEDLSDFPFVKEGVEKLPYGYVKKQILLPLYESGEAIAIAVSTPYAFELIEELRHRFRCQEIKEILAPKEAIEQAIEICYRKASPVSLMVSSNSIEEEDLAGDLLDKSDLHPIVQLLNTLILEAVGQGASDIHFEPEEKKLRVRFRVDGVLHDAHTLSKEIQSELLTRIKVLSQLDIAEQRLPQDGRMKVRMGEREIDFRISTVPLLFGERVVLRILDRSTVRLGLEFLEMPKEILIPLRNQMGRQQGMILVTGPTGSGKTTTLYSALVEIASQEVNVMTIEDPVEFKFPGISQIGVNPKISLTFTTGLRHILRQDPDVIMIGEIRDRETADIAIQAALTGHLLLSTLHTNDAPSAVSRLVDMGIEPFLIADSLRSVLGQRLVRTLCPHCKESYLPSAEEREELELESTELLYRSRGCAHCFFVGYKGRRAIYEMMNCTPAIREALHDLQGSEGLSLLARKEGMIPLREAGIKLVREGMTTTQELFRVTGKRLLNR